MKSKSLYWLLTIASLAEAQQPAKVPQIGYLSGGPAVSARRDAFRDGLRELGYVEKKTLSLSGDMQRENQIVCVSLRPNLYVSR
jgi:hypothetical protein